MSPVSQLSPLTPQSADRWVRSLPPAARAKLAWLPHAVSNAVRPLLSNPRSGKTLDDAVQAIAALFSEIPELAEALERLDTDHALQALRPEFLRQLKMTQGLPPHVWRPAMRALITQRMFISAALTAVSSGYVKLGRRRAHPGIPFDFDAEPFVRLIVLVSALFTGLEVRASPKAVAALAASADDEARRLSRELAQHGLAGIKLENPVYVESVKGSGRFKAVALWAEPRQRMNDELSARLRSWRQHGLRDEAKLLTKVKTGLDAERPHDRKLFRD